MSSKNIKQWVIETVGVAALLLPVVLIYARTVWFPAIDYDDGPMIFDHPVVKLGLSWEGFSWALTHGLHGIWMPLTALTHMADMSLFGTWAGGHHLTNMFWHALAVLMFYAALRALTGARGLSLLAAALFAAHPLRVEAVAWISSRKDLVCGAGFALSLLTYAWYGRYPSLTRYALLFAAVLLALAGKTSAAPIPAVLLLLDMWPLDRFHNDETGRFPFRRALWLVAEKIPFGLLAITVMVVTWRAQHEVGGAVETGAAPLLQRVAAVGCFYFHYLTGFLWPVGLSPHYPAFAFVLWQVLASWGVVLALSLAALATRRHRPWLTIGWFWFLVTLIPVVGLMPYGNTPLADRYMYLPGMGLSLAAAGILCEVGERLCRRGLAKNMGGAMAAVLIACLAAVSWWQTGFWRDTHTAFGRVVQLYPNDDLGLARVGDWRFDQGDLEGATKLYLEAIRIRPDCPDWNYNLGSMLVAGDPGRALPFLEEAARLAPGRGDIRTNVGYALLQLKQPAAALLHLEAGARMDAQNPNAQVNLGVALMNLGRAEEARTAFQRALVLDPANAAAQANLRLLNQ